MVKVGIITLNGEFNYGNRLQNFALQYILKNNGISVETIVISPTISAKIKQELLLGEMSSISDFKYVLKKIIKKLTVKNTLKRIRYKKMQREKFRVIHPFTRNYISTVNVSKEDLALIDHEYGLYIVGSDQVWNPNIIEFDTTHFLSFTDPKKRFSYAASVGVADIPNIPSGLKEHYKRYLEQMKYISVRECSGADIVYDLLNKEVDVAPDPTLLLNKNEWLQALNIKNQDDNRAPYILMYFISGASDKTLDYVHLLAKQKNLEVVQIMGDLYDESHCIVSPDEFVQMINNAEYFFTDSFHGSVFSIIMKTKFLVFGRTDGKGINSRLETLLKNFGLLQLLSNDSKDVFHIDRLNNFINVDKIHKVEKMRGIKLISDNILKHCEE